jgi:hypothetical protein
MTRFEGIGAFESSFHPPPETLCELIYDTCGDLVLKAFNAQRPAIGPDHRKLSNARLVGYTEITGERSVKFQFAGYPRSPISA